MGTGATLVKVSFANWDKGQVRSLELELRTISPRSGPPALPVSPRLTKKLIHPDHDEILFPVLFSPDGQSILATSGTSHKLQIWNAKTGEQIRTLQLPKRVIRDRTFIYGGTGTLAPDGRTLYVTFSKEQFSPIRKEGKISYHLEVEGEILVWDVTTGRQLPSLKQSPPHCVTNVRVSPDGATLLTGDVVGDDASRTRRKNSLTRWDTRTGEHHHLLDGWSDPLAPLFAPDGKAFALSFSDVRAIAPKTLKSRGKLILCDTASGKERLVFAQTDNGRIIAMNFSPDGRYLAGIQEDLWSTKAPPSEVKLWEVATGKEVGAIAAPEGATPSRRSGQVMGAFASAVFSPDSRWLAACLHTGRVYLYDVAGRKLAWSQDVKNGYLRAPIKFSPDGRWLAAIGQETPEDLKPREEVSPFDLPQPRIYLFDMKTGGQPEEIVAPHGKVALFDFSPDSKTIALPGTGCVWLFDVSQPLTRK